MKYIIVILALLWLTGCDSADQQTNIYESGSLVGDITGQVALFDSAAFASDRSGVQVSIEGTSHKAESDPAGNWTIKDAPAGTYALVFEKNGYTTLKEYNVQHVGNGTFYYADRKLYKRPSVTPEVLLSPFLVHVYAGDTTLYAYWPIALSSGIKHHLHHSIALLFFSDRPDINVDDPQSYSYLVAGNYADEDSTGLRVAVFQDSLLAHGFLPGQRVYCKPSICVMATPGQKSNSPYIGTGYYNYANKRWYLTGLTTAPSEVKSFIVP